MSCDGIIRWVRSLPCWGGHRSSRITRADFNADVGLDPMGGRERPAPGHQIRPYHESTRQISGGRNITAHGNDGPGRSQRARRGWAYPLQSTEHGAA
eukprot:6116376-Pyramimonas_sp.AAC.1